MGTNANPLRGHSTVHQFSQRKREARSQQAADENIRQTQTQEQESTIPFRRDALLEAEEALFDAAKGTWQWDIRTDVTTWSEQLYWIIGRDSSAGVPPLREHSCFYTSSSWDQLSAATLGLLQTGTPYELRLQMLHADGTRRWVIARGEAVRDDCGYIRHLRGTVEDISESRWRIAKCNSQLQIKPKTDQTISGILIQGHEEENSRIVNELRDNINQKLSLLAVWIQSLSSTFPDSCGEAQIRFAELWRYTAQILADLERISNQLHPCALDLVGITSAISGLCREFETRTGIPVESSCRDVPPENLNQQIGLTFYRVLEELLENVVKHSRAKNVSVNLDHTSIELILRVSDNGVGFASTQAKPVTGLGFVRMGERMRQIGGSLVVLSQPGCGTSVEIRAGLSESLRSLAEAGH
jgi:signal transduction histidine kinase